MRTMTPARPVSRPVYDPGSIAVTVERFREPILVVQDPATGQVGVLPPGEDGEPAAPDAPFRTLASLPALHPENLGDRRFLQAHRVRFPYVAGEMANGIASPALVAALARANMLAFFGSGGLSPTRLEEGLLSIQTAVRQTQLPWGANLIHSPNEPRLEEAAVAMFLKHQVRRISASAFMRLSPHVVWFACKGLRPGADGLPRRTNHVFAKVSRPEVAEAFLRPAPQPILSQLVGEGKLTAEEAALATRIPVAGDVTGEADSGGHTDNRPLSVLIPALCRLRDRIGQEHGYAEPVRVGAAGGICTPAGVAAAFALGAAYVLTGSINQSSVEAGVSPAAKALLAQAGLADVTMAPAADMFEMGVKLQVLRRGTFFPARAAKLYEIYQRYAGLEEIPQAEREHLEKQVFRRPLGEVWQETLAFWQRREPRQAERALREPKHRMALTFRWYLGMASRWAIEGTAERVEDYQIWCGPAMGGFNAWARGSFLEKPENRSVVQIALNLMEGAAAVTRAGQLRMLGVPVPESAFDFRPRPLSLVEPQ